MVQWPDLAGVDALRVGEDVVEIRGLLMEREE
jgi:hypothetical protein